MENFFYSHSDIHHYFQMPKFLKTFFLVVNHYFQISHFPGCKFTIIPSYFPLFLFNFPP